MNAGVLAWARNEVCHRIVSIMLLAVLVAVGGGATVAAFAAARRTDTAFNRLADAGRQPDLSVNSLTGDGIANLDPALLDQVEQLPGVTGLWEVAFVGVAPEGFPNFFAIAVVDRRGDGPRPGIVLEGSDDIQIAELEADEVALNEAMSNRLNAHVGDTIALQSLTAGQFLDAFSQDATIVPAGPNMTVSVAAVSRSLEDVSDAPDPFLIFPPAFYEAHRDEIGTCACVVELNVDRDAIDEVTTQLQQIYPGASIEPAEDYGGRVQRTVDLQRRAWVLIALAAGAAGAVTLAQADRRFAHALAANDDTMRALGMTPRDRLLGNFVVRAPVYVAGAVGAGIVAYALSPVAPVGLTARAEPSPGLRWDGSVIVPGVATVVAVVAVVTAVSSTIAPRSLERSLTIRWLRGPVRSFGTRLSFRAGRGAILGVVLATAGLSGAVTIQRSIDRLLATPALYGNDFDALAFLDSGVAKRAVADELGGDQDVEAVALVWAVQPASDSVTVRVEGPSGSADPQPNAIEPVKGTIAIRLSEGRVPGRPDEVAVGQALLAELGAHVGDRLTVTGIHGSVEMTIVGDNLTPDTDVAGRGFTVTLEGLATLVDPAISGGVARFSPGADHAAVMARHPELEAVVPPSEVGNIGQLGGLPARIGQLLTLLGAAALVNASVVVVRSGRSEWAVLGALGFTRGQVVGVHLWQSAVQAAVGISIGVLVGFVAGSAIQRNLVSGVELPPYTVVPVELWWIAAGALAACVLAGTVSGLVAARQRPVNALRAE